MEKKTFEISFEENGRGNAYFNIYEVVGKKSGYVFDRFISSEDAEKCVEFFGEAYKNEICVAKRQVWINP